MRYYISITITILSVLLLLGTAQTQSNDSLLYFSSDLEIGYEYIWDKIEYTALTFLSDEITEEHNFTIEILKEIDKDIDTLDEGREIIYDGYSFKDGAYDYFLFSYDGIIQTTELILHPEDAGNAPIFIVTANFISLYMTPVVVVGFDGEINNLFDIFAEETPIQPYEEYFVDGEVATYKRTTNGSIVNEIVEYRYDYSTGLLLESNFTRYGEYGLLTQTITSLRNLNIRTEHYTYQGQTSQIPSDDTEIGFLQTPSLWITFVGLATAVVPSNKRKR